MTARKATPTTRPDPHPIKDFFIADLIDYAPKDHKDMMERPFFSIAKRKRLKPIEYENDDKSVWVRVTGSPEHGIATIWDADIIIYCVSRIVAARDRGDNDFGPSIFVTPYELLKSIARDVGGKNYDQLMDAIKRLKTTTIQTNIRGQGGTGTAMFNWLAEIEGKGSGRDPERIDLLELRLSNWLFKGITEKGVLTLDREWFLLKGGLERVIYRIARKHAGDQPQGWTCRFDVLYRKTGSEEPIRNFAGRLRRLVAKNDLPRYHLSLTTTVDNSPAVHFIARRFVEARPELVEGRTERDRARAAWIDSGRNPRAFEKSFEEWQASGAGTQQFIAQYSDPAVKLKAGRSP